MFKRVLTKRLFVFVILALFSCLTIGTSLSFADEEDYNYEFSAIKLIDAQYFEINYSKVLSSDTSSTVSGWNAFLDGLDTIKVLDKSGKEVEFEMDNMKYIEATKSSNGYEKVRFKLDKPFYAPEMYTVKENGNSYKISGVPILVKSVKIINTTKIEVVFDKNITYDSVPNIEIYNSKLKLLNDDDYRIETSGSAPNIVDLEFYNSLYTSSPYSILILGKGYKISFNPLQAKSTTLLNARSICINFNNEMSNLEADIPEISVYDNKNKLLKENIDYNFTLNGLTDNDVVIELKNPFYAPNIYTVKVLGKIFKITGKDLKIVSVSAIDGKHISIQFDKNVTYKDIPPVKLYNKYGSLLLEDYANDLKIGDYETDIPELSPNKLIISLIKTSFYYPNEYTVKVFDKNYKVKGKKLK
jgi:hypothetical protein